MFGFDDVAAGVGTLGTLGVNIANAVNQNKINQQNFDFQQKAYQQNLDLGVLARSREDNAVQRRVADMKAAGLNPVLAAGSPASSMAPIQVTAPQKVATDYSEIAKSSQVMMDMLTKKAELSGILEQNKLTKLQQAKIGVETLSIVANTSGQNIENKTNQENLDVTQKMGIAGRLMGVIGDVVGSIIGLSSLRTPGRVVPVPHKHGMR